MMESDNLMGIEYCWDNPFELQWDNNRYLLEDKSHGKKKSKIYEGACGRINTCCLERKGRRLKGRARVE
jgi:hypothetical protein